MFLSGAPGRPPWLAGFECGFLGWNGHDLLRTTAHLPEARMREHYAIAAALGLRHARDGLPWRHDAGARLSVAAEAGFAVVWDLSHFDPPPDPVAHARDAARAAFGIAPDRPFRICPVNEPSLYPRLAGMGFREAVDLFLLMARVARDHHPRVQVLLTEPITGIGERQFAAADAIVAAGAADAVGVNYYPHSARAPLRRVLLKTWRRYRLPVLLSETSWHDGHPVHHRRHPGWTKGDWFRHVADEARRAAEGGADVAGLCWYPFVDCPPWNRPRARERWAHGLIRADASVDPFLADALREARVPPRPETGQLAFGFEPAEGA